MDLTTQALWNYSVRYVLVIMELRSRRVVHVAVTASPTLAWVKRQVREATPFGSVPRFLVHDNDGIFGQFWKRRPGESGKSYRCALDMWLGEVLHIKGIPIPLRSPCGGPHRAVHGKPEEGVPQPLHLHVGRSPSPHRLDLHHLLQRRSTSSGNRGHTGVWSRLTEGLSSSDRGRPDQVRGTPSARRSSRRLPTRGVARAHAKSPRHGPIGSGRSWSCMQRRILT